MGATLSWRGRDLVEYEKGNKEILYSYDVDGMRYRKVVKTNGTETSRYDYVYSDGRLVTITYTANDTSKTARFIYDSYGEVRGFILDNSASYLYLKNAQGDITAIVDENGAVILTCTYDAWGVVTFGATSMESMALAAELSKINPFTYRGYCYDYDIEMYYLQSRYYDPEICRFINADSTDYLGATGTLLSYNLFAYCENDPVGCVDATGTWAKDVHLGYFVDKPEDGTYNYIGGIYKYTGAKGVYMPFYTAKNGDRIYYGTYLWAIQCNIKPDYAKIIAYYCNYVDNLKNGTAPVPYIGDQSWHFNTNWTTNQTDSRILNSNKMIAQAKKYFDNREIYKGLECLGKALHPIQDIFAHTRDKCYGAYERVYAQGPNIRVVRYVIVWSHLGVKNVDNARVRTNQLRYAANQTKRILNEFSNKYFFLRYWI